MTTGYRTSIAYRGLFRSVPVGPEDERLVILLVDGTTPRATSLHQAKSLGRPFTREHHAYLEFRFEDWAGGDDPRVALPGCTVVERPRKGRTVLWSLAGHDLHFPGESGLTRDDSYDLLPQLDRIEEGSGLVDPGLLQQGRWSLEEPPPYTSRSLHASGRFGSTRPSRYGLEDVSWAFSPAEKPTPEEGVCAGPMNLDVAVDLEERSGALRIEARPFDGSASRWIELAPAGGGWLLELWIFNWEMQAILGDDLLTTDGDHAPGLCEFSEKIDLDWELHYLLSQSSGLRRIPVAIDANPPSCCCGGAGGGSGE